jgi:DnaJ-class molecular chaperone
VPNRPSQKCRVCRGSGVLLRPNLESEHCPVCHGRGKITIWLATAIGWRPVVHRKRVPHPENQELFS